MPNRLFNCGHSVRSAVAILVVLMIGAGQTALAAFVAGWPGSGNEAGNRAMVVGNGNYGPGTSAGESNITLFAGRRSLRSDVTRMPQVTTLSERG